MSYGEEVRRAEYGDPRLFYLWSKGKCNMIMGLVHLCNTDRMDWSYVILFGEDVIIMEVLTSS